MSLSREGRRALPDDLFAVPAKRALPIPDGRHVQMAWAQHMKAAGLTDAEREEAKARILERAEKLGVELKSAAETGLYVSRQLTPASAAAFRTWAKSQGFLDPMPGKELHVTIVHSPIAPALTPHDHHLVVEGGDRSVVRMAGNGDKGNFSLRFESEELQERWLEAVAAGATSDFEQYLPHITIAYGGQPTEPDDISPFTGELVFGPEVHEPLNPNALEEKGLMLAAATSVRLEGESLEAMALEMPAGPHPNKMPFSGILTRLDTPSDKAPGGSNGKKVIFTKRAAERGLSSLLGMGVDFTPDFDGHDTTRKIGVITAATIEGDAIRVGGFIYARDFPKEASRIQLDKALLGFSWELADIFVERTDADPLVITDACFTGAAILRKDKAAYRSTSLAASADEDTMTKEEIAAAMGEALAPAIKPLADAMTAMAEASAKQTEALTAMQAAATTKVDETAKAKEEADATKLADLETQVKDLRAAAEKASKEPERKTLSPQITQLLARADLTVPDDGKLTVGAVDAALAKAGLDPAKRIQIKSELKHAGAL